MDAGHQPLRGRAPSGWSRLGIDRERVHRIPHGAFDYLTAHRRPTAAAAGPRRGRGAGRPLLRADPPLQGDRRPAARRFASSRGPSCGSSACRGCRSSRCERAGPTQPLAVRFVPRFVTDPEIPALLRARRPRRPALPRDRAVGRPLHGARVRQARSSPARSGASPRSGPAIARCAWSRPATPTRCGRRSRSCSPTRARAPSSRRPPRAPPRAPTPGIGSPRETLALYRALVAG